MHDECMISSTSSLFNLLRFQTNVFEGDDTATVIGEETVSVTSVCVSIVCRSIACCVVYRRSSGNTAVNCKRSTKDHCASSRIWSKSGASLDSRPNFAFTLDMAKTFRRAFY